MIRPLPSLSRLRALQVVCKTGSYSEAAHELFLTQPAVSKQISQLETETGLRLVERIGKTTRATPEGERLIACAARIFDELDGTLQALAGMQDAVTGRVVIGAGATATTYLLPGILAGLEQRHPGIEIATVNGNTPDLVPKLVEASLDIAILTAPVTDPRLEQALFFLDRLVCIAPAEAEIRRKSLRPQDLSGRRLILYERGGTIRGIVDGWLNRSAAPAPKVLEIGSAEAQKSFVRSGFGWSIISEMAVAEEVEQSLLQVIGLSPLLSRQLIVVWRRDRSANPAIAAAREALLRYGAGDSVKK
ncbi:MAG: LysR family transcriptional regulator [Kiloniellales bacterium]|nr:LysR family transcriptional regulator [Kiloniellales bacterium]